MGLHYDIFPDNLSLGSRGGPGYLTSAHETRAGEDSAVSHWPQAKRRYNAKFALITHADVADLLKFYIARDGIANHFPFKDWSDYATTASGTLHNPGDGTTSTTDVTIGVGDGSTTQFQLIKTYVSGSEFRNRTIRLPKTGTVKIAVSGVTKTLGTDFTVDNTTGFVTFAVAPAIAAIVTAGFEFYVPVKFDKAVDQVLQAQFEEFNAESLPDVPLKEVNNDVATSEEVPMGGGIAQTLSTNTQYDYSMGVCVPLIPLVNNVQFYFPPIADLDEGGPHLWVKNEHGSNNVVLYSAPGGTAMATLAATKWAAGFVLNDSGTKRWVLFGNP